MARFYINAIIEYKYYLLLNPMMSNIETYNKFGPFNTREEAIDFYNRLHVEPYTEEGPDLFSDNPSDTKTYRKSFAKGSELEWYNPLFDHEFMKPNDFQHGLHEVIESIENIQHISPA